MTEWDRLEMLQQHNIYRCMHQVTLMTWDEELASAAQAWADKSFWGHSTDADEGMYGQNLEWMMPKEKATAREAVKAWYSETMKTSSPMVTRHYQAVIWKNTIRLGCGKGSLERHGNDARLWVCHYSPTPGEPAEFRENVLMPTVSWSRCGGTAEDVVEGFPNLWALPWPGSVPPPLPTPGPVAIAPMPDDPSIPLAIAYPPEDTSSTTSTTRQKAAEAEQEENVITMMGQRVRGDPVAPPVEAMASNHGEMWTSSAAAGTGVLLVFVAIAVGSQHVGQRSPSEGVGAVDARHVQIEHSDSEE